MAMTIKESSQLDSLAKPASAAGGSESNAGQNSRSNPVCLEVAVTIRRLPEDNGEASPGQAQPAREEARSVIVFDNGAVLRLAGDFPAGQAVIVSNPQGRDVVCRVVSARSLPSVKGYIEIEFVEPVNDFWGIHRAAGQASVPNPPATAVAQPQIVPSEPLPAPPAPPRATPIAPETITPTGNAPSFEDIAGLVRMSPPPAGRAKTAESTPRISPSKDARESAHDSFEVPRSYSPVSAPALTADLTSPSAAWESADHPVRTLSASDDVPGKGVFSSAQTSSMHPSAKSRGKTILIVAGVAVFVVGLGTGWFFMHQGGAATPYSRGLQVPARPAGGEPASSAPVPVVASQPSVPASPAANVPPPAVREQVVEEPAPPSTPAVSPVSSVSTESAAAPVPSAPQTTRRPANNVNVKQPEPLAQVRTAIPDLKMRGPTSESRNVGRLVDGSVPVIEDAATVSPMIPNSAGAVPPTVAHVDFPPALPVSAVGSGSAAKTVRDPKLISSTRPVYPPMAKQSNVEGDVLVSAEIDANGTVIVAKALSGPMFLRQAAENTIRQWKYEPALVNGKPVPGQVSVKLQFRLNK
jgi:TonB family protein